ncbi:MAG: BCCT family transporter [Eubacteriaceae bacterium]|nr:BCCT family transporter [Eubacteriaceae bacterium]
MKKERKPLLKMVEPVVFFPAFIVMLGVTIIGFVNYDALLNGLLTVYQWATTNFGWIYAAITVINLVICLILFVHPVGKIRLGGKDAKPELTGFAWFSITLTSTIGISLIMWGSVEPIVHFTNPPAFAGVKALSEGAATFALSTGYIHWSFNQYALYTFAAVAVAIAHFNYNQPLTVGAGMYFATKGNKTAGKLADALCLIVIVGGVATSLGIGITQIATGLNYSFGIPVNSLVKLVVALAIIITYTAASISGIKKGISAISKINVWIFFGLLIFVYLVGPTLFINKLGLQSLGEWLYSGLKRTLMLGPITNDPWHDNWTINFFIANAAYAPLMGVFLAKLGKGRTIRQFVGVNLGICSIFNIVWFNIFGGASIYSQLHGLDLAAIMDANGLQSAAFAFFQSLPGGVVIVPVFTIAIFLSFVTMAESMCTSMSALSMKGGLAANEDEPSNGLKLVWGVFVGALAYLLLGLMGVDVIKYTYMVFGFPIFIVMVVTIYSLCKFMFFPDFELIKTIKSQFKKGDGGEDSGSNGEKTPDQEVPTDNVNGVLEQKDGEAVLEKTPVEALTTESINTQGI